MSDVSAEPSSPPIDPASVAEALEGDRFKQFLDHVPVAVAVSELQPSEIVTYANLEFQRLTGRDAAQIEGRSWRSLPGIASADGDERLLRDAVLDDSDYIGVFRIERDSGPIDVDVWSSTIENDAGEPIYRLVAMGSAPNAVEDAAAKALIDKDTLLRELQHRVKNNLQMITALIRLEARSVTGDDGAERLSRLAGRINALAVLYEALSHNETGDSVDLGAYLGQIAAAIMQAHAVEGIRLDTRIDTWPVTVNVAMPAGLVVNELLTNALKHAFVGRDGGVIKLHSLIDDDGCHITIADDGVGFAEGTSWPQPGRLSAMILHSLKQNAAATVSVTSTPGAGVAVTIFFARPALESSAV